MKTKRGAAKRFRFTKSGKIKRERAYLNHLRTSKSPKQKRRLRRQTMVAKSNERAVKRMILT